MLASEAMPENRPVPIQVMDRNRDCQGKGLLPLELQNAHPECTGRSESFTAILPSSKRWKRVLVYDENCDNPLHRGVKVGHLKFGNGIVTNVSGSGENTRVEVRFSDGIVRKLILKYAGLKILD